MRTIRRLLALSLLYNAAGAAAAVAGLVTPLVAAVAMPVSSLLVVTLAILQPSFRDPSVVRGRSLVDHEPRTTDHGPPP
jgi:Cu2+-exporting ATPase